jgi:D-glycero-alpha-D-manno-heptose-7-phosphate kinase
MKKYDVAMLAYKIERKDLNLVGGIQDQFSASYGGFNLIEIKKKSKKIIIKPLKISNYIKNELSSKFLLLYTGISRGSEKIIETQIQNIENNDKKGIRSMLKLKKNTIKMKSYLLNDFKLNNVIEILASNWLLKKNTGRGVSNYLINRITNKLYKYGAEAVKISGAGGGGFILVVTPTENIFYLKKNLKLKNAIFYNFGFEPKGAQSWTVK